MNATDIRIQEIAHEYEDFLYRTPIKFGGVVLDRVTLLNVHAVVGTASGKLARGFGSMPLGNVWAFPSKILSYDTTLEAMKVLAERIARLTGACNEAQHPIDLNHVLEPEYLKAAEEVSGQLNLVEPIPKLATLVVASAFDAALHDAYGKVHGLNCYAAYGRDFLHHDLSHYLGPKFQGEFLDQTLMTQPMSRLPLYHLVGALDPLKESEVARRLDDGLPETLTDWISFNGLTHLKIKLNGDDLSWDVDRLLRVEGVTTRAQQLRGVKKWVYSLDFNERCPNPEYPLEFLRQVREKAPDGFERIQYLEQPTARDLKANRTNRMHEVARLRPVVIDESLTDLESLLLARDLGYTGAALKACKGQSQSLLLAAAARKLGMFLCVQDLTCPGASLIQSAGLAAHVPGVAALEANARQFVPAANRLWESRFPGLFHVTDGTMATGLLTGPGLGAVQN